METVQIFIKTEEEEQEEEEVSEAQYVKSER